MPPRRNESSGASTALAVIGLTTQVAVAATDGIPVVKQVLAVATHIITLVEDIEKRRDALHGLADTARTLVQSLETVVADRELGAEVARRLVALHSVLQSIEALLEKHRAKKPLRKALSYAFTISKRIDDLNQELSRAIQGFQLVAAADTNAQVREDPRYIGEFRRIRHCDVEDLELIEEHPIGWTGYSCKIYTAKVGGSVCILRCFARKSEGRRDGKSDREEWHRRRVIEHDQLLQKLSTVQNLHPNVARLYARSSGEHFDRFNVMNIGCIPISELPQCTATEDGTWNVVRQLLDALCHLNECGATWNPRPFQSIFIDGTGAPIIGLQNDLRSSAKCVYWCQIWALGGLLVHALKASWLESYIHADENHPLAISTVGSMRASSFNTIRRSIPRRLIPSLDEKICRYLQNALASCEDELAVWDATGSVLRAAASGRALGSKVHTFYCPHAGGQDRIDMFRVEERDDELIHSETRIDVPVHMKDEVRKKLGITLPASEGDWFVSNCDPAGPSMSFRPDWS